MKIKRIIKRNKMLYVLFQYLITYINSIYYFLLMYIFKIFKIKNNKIIINNYYGKGFGDMGKYISLELLNKNFDIYWACKKKYKESLPNGIKYVSYNSINYLYHLATSKIWINNCRFRYGIIKRKEQFYIQTWHGCIGFKRCERLAENVLSYQYVKGAKNDSKIADLFISNSDFCTDNYKQNFWYDGKILKCGCPRNDIIINQDSNIVNKIKEKYGLKKDTKICLYAPTFRANSSLNPYNINYENLIKSLHSRFGGNWKVFLRLHPNISNLSELLKQNKQVINVTDYPDMQELLVASDFMITDYSSCVFDYAISNKPAVIYASDIDEYMRDRNFLIKLDETPFEITKNNEELTKRIIDFDIAAYQKKINVFFDKVGLYEPGDSSKTISNLILEITNERK